MRLSRWTIHRQFIVMSAVVALFSLALLGLTLLLLENQDTVVRAEMVSRTSIDLARELRHSSDELTRLARTYVVTGDSAYERAYWEILAVRNGTAPRADGSRISLRTLMQNIGFTEAEFAKLKEAEDNSNALVATETAAFQAVIGRFLPRPGAMSLNAADYTRTGPIDRAFAVRIMHDKKYHDDKAVIMAPIDDAIVMVMARTQGAVESAVARSRHLILLSSVASVLLIGMLAVSYLTAQRPVLRAVESLRVQLDGLSSGRASLSTRLQVTRRDELGEVAAAFNRLMDRLLGLVQRIQESGIRVTSSSTQLSASSRGFESTLNEQVASTNEVVSAARQISATAQSLVTTMADVADQLHEAAASAGEGQTGLARMRQTMETMETASATIAQKLAAINAKVTNITAVVTTIQKVANQTNLLSLNAAIEAAKAGEFGQGFAVVAREIRRLADQAAIATLDIEQIVKEMQSSVSSGVMSMEKFAQDVQGAVHEVRDIGGQLGQIIEQVQGLAPRFASVNEGMESQSVGARQISESMLQLGAATRATADSLRESGQALQSLDDAAHILHEEMALFQVNAPGARPPGRSAAPRLPKEAAS